MSKTVIQIVQDGLKAEGYSGLRTPDGSCGCEIDDLCPCASDFAMCEAGHKHSDPHRPTVWAIFPGKEAPAPEAFDGIED